MGTITDQVELHYGKSTLALKAPNQAKLHVISPSTIRPQTSDDALIKDALDHPIGSEPLESLAPAGSGICILVDDLTRPTPVRLLLQKVLERLRAGGHKDRDISIAVALGTHRPMTRAELQERLGSDILANHRVINEDCSAEDAFEYCGETTGGVPAWVHKAVANADIRIGLGSIVPHTDAGYSGGAKIILPGVCGLESIVAFHRQQTFGSIDRLGDESAPLRVELERFVAEKIGLEFILNVVLDVNGGLYEVAAGHYKQAHRRGCGMAKEVYGVPVARPYPVVVSNAFPMQCDLWQSTKAISSAAPITEDGGELILLTHSEEGLSNHAYYAEYIGSTPDKLREMLTDPGTEDKVGCALAMDIARIKQRINISLVSDGLNADDAATMGFGYHATLDDAVQHALKKTKAKEMAVLTHGGICWPYVAEGE